MRSHDAAATAQIKTATLERRRLSRKKVEMPKGGPASPVRCFGSEGEQSVAEEKNAGLKKGGDAERGRPGISGEVRLL